MSQPAEVKQVRCGLPGKLLGRVLFLRGPLSASDAEELTADEAALFCTLGAKPSFFGFEPSDIEIDGEVLPSQLRHYLVHTNSCKNDRHPLKVLQCAWQTENSVGVFQNAAVASEEELRVVFGDPHSTSSDSDVIEAAGCILMKRASLNAFERLFWSDGEQFIPPSIIAAALKSGRVESVRWLLTHAYDQVLSPIGEFMHQYSTEKNVPLACAEPTKDVFQEPVPTITPAELVFTFACNAPREDAAVFLLERLFSNLAIGPRAPQPGAVHQAFFNAFQYGYTCVQNWLIGRFGCQPLLDLLDRLESRSHVRYWRPHIHLKDERLLSAVRTLFRSTRVRVPYIESLLTTAAVADDSELIDQYVKQRKMSIRLAVTGHMPVTAAANGSNKVLRWSIENGLATETDALVSTLFGAIQGDQTSSMRMILDVLRTTSWHADEQSRLTEMRSVWHDALFFSKFNALKLLVAEWPGEFERWLLKMETSSPHWPHMLVRMGYVRRSAMQAASQGSVDMARWLLDVVQRLRDSTPPPKDDPEDPDEVPFSDSPMELHFLEQAISNGNIEGVRWFLDELKVEKMDLHTFIANVDTTQLRRSGEPPAFTIFTMKLDESIYDFKQRLQKAAVCFQLCIQRASSDD